MKTLPLLPEEMDLLLEETYAQDQGEEVVLYTPRQSLRDIQCRCSHTRQGHNRVGRCMECTECAGFWASRPAAVTP